MKRVAIYARVSTADQSADLQLRECREFCRCREDWQIVDEFVDEGFSGSKKSRPALDRLLALAQRKEVDTVLVWKFDRFARSLSFLVNQLEQFQSLGIDFISLRENVDTGTANGRLFFSIFGALAEFERELIRERTRAGMKAAKARGTHCGHPRVITIDESRANVLRREGKSWVRVAAELGCNRETLRRRVSR